jgi:hypothetical protein
MTINTKTERLTQLVQPTLSVLNAARPVPVLQSTLSIIHAARPARSQRRTARRERADLALSATNPSNLRRRPRPRSTCNRRTQAPQPRHPQPAHAPSCRVRPGARAAASWRRPSEHLQGSPDNSSRAQGLDSAIYFRESDERQQTPVPCSVWRIVGFCCIIKLPNRDPRTPEPHQPSSKPARRPINAFRPSADSRTRSGTQLGSIRHRSPTPAEVAQLNPIVTHKRGGYYEHSRGEPASQEVLPKVRTVDFRALTSYMATGLCLFQSRSVPKVQNSSHRHGSSPRLCHRHSTSTATTASCAAAPAQPAEPHIAQPHSRKTRRFHSGGPACHLRAFAGERTRRQAHSRTKSWS